MPPNQAHIETEVISKALTKHRENCPYEKEKENWLDARFLKVAGVIIGLLSPLFVWIIVSIFSLQSQVAVQNEKIGTLLEIKQDISSIKSDIQQLKIDVSVLKSKGNP